WDCELAVRGAFLDLYVDAPFWTLPPGRSFLDDPAVSFFACLQSAPRDGRYATLVGRSCNACSDEGHCPETGRIRGYGFQSPARLSRAERGNTRARAEPGQGDELRAESGGPRVGQRPDVQHWTRHSGFGASVFCAD